MTPSNDRPKTTVLYVDDDLENLESFKAVFRRDYDVHIAHSAKEAMEILSQITIQVLITDQRMPEMSGSELLRQLADQYPDMLRFMLTGFSDFDPLVHALNDGRLQGYFTKPIDIKEMKKRIEKGLSKYYLKLENEALYQSLQQREQQVKSQLSELEQVYSATPVGLIMVDTDLRIVRINEKMAEIYGLPVGAYLGKTLVEAVPELADDLEQIYRPVLETGVPITNVAIHGTTPAQPGIERDWLGSYFPYKTEEGTINGVIGGVMEITKLKQAEREAQESRHFAENLLKTANAMIVVLDPNGCVRLVNPMVEKLTGYTEDELIGQNWFERIVPKESYPHVWVEFERLMSGGIPKVFENPILTKDGSERIISWSNTELKDIDTSAGTLSVGIDITKRRLAESERERLADQLRQAQKMEAIGTLAGGIAHDFNNILSPIIGYAEIISSDSEPDSANKSSAEEILHAGMRARELVHQILTFSREKEQEKKPIKIQPVIIEALKLLRASVPATIELDHQIDEGCSPILGDPTQIYQVIMNLCTNAYQAMQDQSGRISIEISETLLTEEDRPQFMELEIGPHVRLTVADTGPGIEPEIIERIFDPYFTTKRMKSGTGLGLSVVHGIVKGHSGAIKVYSELGQGTSFSVYFPCLMERKPVSEVQVDEVSPGGSESILLIDDEAALVRLMHKILEKLGYRVTSFTDAREALSTFKQDPHAFDLVISDMTMPYLSGLDLSQAILEERPDIPILICTGFSEVISQIKVTKTGIRSVIKKPILTTEIAETVRQVLADNR